MTPPTIDSGSLPKTTTSSSPTMADSNEDFEQVVSDYYQDLYRFAYSLVRNEADAVDLTQQTFYRYAKKKHTIRDVSKTKSWLFRTLKNDFLNQAQRKNRFQHVSVDDATHELPTEESSTERALDAKLVLQALSTVEESYRVALSLFYMKGLAYREIAEVLEVPIGTVMSRISRGKAQLKSALGDGA